VTPDEEEQVRRALASAGPVRMPEDVERRLRAVIEDLPDQPTAEPDQLAERRHRRWPQALVAAAVVAVVAVGVGVAVNASGSGSSSSTASGAADTAGLPKAGPQRSAAGAATAEVQPNGTANGTRVGAVPDLHRSSLHADVLRVTRSTAPTRHPAGLRAGAAPCDQLRTGPGDRVYPVRLDGAPATLVVRAPQHGTSEAQVFSCGDAHSPDARTSVPAG
jgi:hypothetical protein